MPEVVDPGTSSPSGTEPVGVLRVDEEEAWEIVEPTLPIETQQRIAVIQRLLAAAGTKSYGKVQQRAAKELGITVRSLQRLVKRWRELGIAGLSKQARSECTEVHATRTRCSQNQFGVARICSQDISGRQSRQSIRLRHAGRDR